MAHRREILFLLLCKTDLICALDQFSLYFVLHNKGKLVCIFCRFYAMHQYDL